MALRKCPTCTSSVSTLYVCKVCPRTFCDVCKSGGTNSLISSAVGPCGHNDYNVIRWVPVDAIFKSYYSNQIAQVLAICAILLGQTHEIWNVPLGTFLPKKINFVRLPYYFVWTTIFTRLNLVHSENLAKIVVQIFRKCVPLQKTFPLWHQFFPTNYCPWKHCVLPTM